ncbi:DnaA N-terminal domain-containing protein [Clostridium cavendishii DSM 21758]|uniref:DnaA N-terminal domain-containing protein n=1 Tax=Clostridium cavendishii DSM 21758 TaxID=1121302 RepID=A0A1M6K2Y5_9CLOT|nr:DnaA N-terminal domain-containing protein [Clostridium cavendishii]SHJ53308.1 DnaA N-terminal domain-containing protein [Clostridium cavendishii DSM 21758]
MSEGWFKLHRCLFEKAIWQQSTPEQKVILITLLGLANHKGREWEWKGTQFKAEPGMLVTSLESITARCGKGISIQNVRSAITKFKKYGFLTEEVTKTGRLITILNWGLYQGGEYITNKDTNNQVTNNQQSTNKEVTNSQQRGNKEVTPNKNDKNIKNDKNEKEGKEREEEISILPPLSFPTEYHKSIFDKVGEVGYRTWFINSNITDGPVITIEAPNEFTKNIVEEKYKKHLELILKKKIEIK